MDIKQRLKNMTLMEKIGQKIMLDFRYWDHDARSNKDMIAPDDSIGRLITDNHIGGVILFGNNLKNKLQIKTLTAWYKSLKSCGDIGLFIATDNEGGNIFRLPRDEYASFPGNMALSAAIEGGADIQLASEQGSQMAQDMISLHINTNFAPVVDINTNPYNPVINVRAFSNEVSMVSRLAEKMAAGMRQQGMITVYKHFPGHGSTSTDSHTGLPRVDRSRKYAFGVDIAPYKHAIDNHEAPDMIMTAHIQYPALDNSLVINRNGEEITVPATMSREIQTHILRDKLGFAGVTISDALDMGAITDNFDRDTAIERVFSAGVDIALMPVSIASPSQLNLLPELIQGILEKIKQGIISEKDIDSSVERILRLKKKYYLFGNESKEISNHSFRPVSNPEPSVQFDDASRSHNHPNPEKKIADRSITVLINRQSTLPLNDKELHYFILTPWDEQAKGIASVMFRYGYLNIVAAKEADLTDKEIKEYIAACDVFLLGTLSTFYSLAEKNSIHSTGIVNGSSERYYLSWLRYAAEQGKRIHLSLRAPYDIVNYARDVDAAVAVYSYCGFNNGVWRGPSMISLAEILTNKRQPKGKLPVNTWYDYDEMSNSGTVAYPRGYGLEWGE